MNDGQPVTPAPNPQGSTAPGQPPSTPSAQPPKSNKTLIIILVVVFLLLCSCCVVAGGGFAFYTNLQQEMDPLADADDSDSGATSEPSLEESALAEWNAWEPAPGNLVVVPPNATQQDLANEIMTQIYPQFTLDELLIEEGGYDASDDSYWTDTYYIRAHLTEHPEAEIVEYVDVPITTRVESGQSSMNMESFPEDSLRGTLDGGIEYVYPGDNLLLDGPTEPIQQLLSTVAEQWPGGVVARAVYDDDGGTAVWVAMSTWEQFFNTENPDGVWAVYVLQDGEWVLDEYEWLSD